MAKHYWHDRITEAEVFNATIIAIDPSSMRYTVSRGESQLPLGSPPQDRFIRGTLPDHRHRMHEWRGPECAGNRCTMISSESLVSLYLTHGTIR